MVSTTVVNNSTQRLTVAEKLMQKHHEAQNTTMQGLIAQEGSTSNEILSISSNRDFVATAGLSDSIHPALANNTGRQKVELETASFHQLLDTQSDKNFPGLGAGAPKTISPPVWGANKSTIDGHLPSISNGNSSNSVNNDASSGSTLNSTHKTLPQSLVGQIQPPLLTLQTKDVLPRNLLKKPIPDTLKDINRRLRTNLTMMTGQGGILEFRDTSKQKESLKNQGIMELGNLIGAKKSIKIPVPRSTRAYIIGKQGSTIKALQESTGAKIQVPKIDENYTSAEEDDDTVDLTIEGNIIAIQLAQKEIGKIVSERCVSVQKKLRNIPVEFYPFISGPNNMKLNALEQTHNVQIHVPSQHIWTINPPPQKPPAGKLPKFSPPASDELITIIGDRANIQAAQVEIEQITQKLHQEITVEQFMVNNSQHQFIIGEQGVSLQSFFTKTGCGIILPSDPSEDSITVIGPPEHIENAMDYAIDLASSMNQTIIDISRLYRNHQGNARLHARNITNYLLDRNEIKNLCQRYQIHIATPMDSEGAAPWEVFYRSEHSKIATKAQTEVGSIILAHPPARMATINTDSFFHDYLRRSIAQSVKNDYGVHIVIPKRNSNDDVLLVYEGNTESGSDYQIPRERPDAALTKVFEQSLADARKYIDGILSKQAQIVETSLDVPRIFHEKLRRFIQSSQQERAADKIPVRVFVSGTKLTLRGPEPAVEALSTKVHAFVTQAIEEEKERDFSLPFNFPQKHANQLIGKGGNNIRGLKEKFDVDINVNDGIVEVKGPKIKAENAKSHIISLGKQWADEVTYILKIDPSFHRELIGHQGVQINRLQTRYKVQIYFPRSAKPSKDDQSVADNVSEIGRRDLRKEQEQDEVIVKGPKRGANDARDEILTLYQYLRDNSHSASVWVQAGQISSLIGQRGSAMEEIRQTTTAKIEIPNAKDIEDPSTRVEIQIKGTKASVAQAKKLIEDKKIAFDNTVIKTLEIDKEHHRALIGPQGSIIRDIIIKAGGSDDRRELARTVQFPRTETKDNLIKVEGDADMVDKIITAMRKIVQDRESQICGLLEVPIEKHRSLIGRNGEIRKNLENTFNVSIEVPRQGSCLKEVKINGLPSNVEKAKAHISDLVSEREGETIQIPRYLHHYMTDNGQIFRVLRNNYKVTVDHGGHKIPEKPVKGNSRPSNQSLPLITDDIAEEKNVYLFSTVDIQSSSGNDRMIPWILRGTPENVMDAKAYLTKVFEQESKNTTHGYLTLPDTRTYRFIIGPGGSTVQAIRKSTGCKIIVPRDHKDEEAIEIIGTSEGVEKAKEMILISVKSSTGPIDDQSADFEVRRKNYTSRERRN
ncbi:Vigilin 1 [Golovinomyces cichoracearum]|uniref:Vigilin 1 n=1 Tax=Golovinomyces cichoracearum TaxID=62708 RepID=A0A420J4C3_9PEZI|nr:Vigilin 1 [Golovinomyces cichoracearum]